MSIFNPIITSACVKEFLITDVEDFVYFDIHDDFSVIWINSKARIQTKADAEEMM